MKSLHSTSRLLNNEGNLKPQGERRTRQKEPEKCLKRNSSPGATNEIERLTLAALNNTLSKEGKTAWLLLQSEGTPWSDILLSQRQQLFKQTTTTD